jgi:hypothetical protein
LEDSIAIGRFHVAIGRFHASFEPLLAVSKNKMPRPMKPSNCYMKSSNGHGTFQRSKKYLNLTIATWNPPMAIEPSYLHGTF